MRTFCLLLIFCTLGCAAKGKPLAAEPPPATTRSGAAALVGTIVYRQPLGPGAVARVRLIDLAGVPAPLAEVRITPLPSSPVPFVLPYDPARVTAGADCFVSVRIESAGGTLLLINTSAYPVLGPGRPERADVVVERLR